MHRDIKPRNVLVSNTHYCNLTNPHEIEQAWLQEGIICKLADFGEHRSVMHQLRNDKVVKIVAVVETELSKLKDK